MRRLLVVLTLLLLPAAVPVAAVAATGQGAARAAHADRPFPGRIALPDGFQPEGIEAGRGTTVYVGSLADGRIWRGDVRTGTGSVWSPATGTPALGLAFDARRHLLWVAGGPSGLVRAYDTRTSALVRTYSFPGSGFLNDLVVTRRGVYVTDSVVQRLAVIPFRRGGRLPASGTTLPLTGDVSYLPPPAFNANGIVASRGYLIVALSDQGQLLRVDPTTGVARRIRTGGTDLVAADGLELRGGLLYVVRNTGVVQRLLLGPRLLAALPVGQLTGDTDYPSTGTFVAGSLYVVNARFATTPTPTTPYWITRLGR